MRNLLLLLVLACFWGPSFLFIKLALRELPPVTIVSARVTLAAIMLLCVAKLQGFTVLEPWRKVRHYCMLGVLHSAFPFAAIAWGQQNIDSALAGILNGTTPLCAMVAAHLFLHDERLAPRKIAGGMLGLVGLVVILLPSLLAGMSWSLLGMISVTAGAMSYGLGNVYARRYMRGALPQVAATWQLAFAALLLLPIAAWFERPWLLPPPGLTSLGSIAFLSIIGTGAAYLLFYWLLERTSAGYVASVTYLIPLVAIVLGSVVLQEQLRINQLAGGALILVGVLLVTSARIGPAPVERT